MTLFQHVAVWSLRALLLWGAFELATSIYFESMSQMEKLGEVRGHEAAMQKLDERARRAERALRGEQLRLGAMQGLVWAAPAGRTSASPGDAVAAQARADLMEFGASQVMLETVEAPLTADLARVSIDARWREPTAQAPSVFDRLAARRANISLAQLKMERAEGAQDVQVEARLEAVVRRPQASPRRESPQARARETQRSEARAR
jgi:hypothetical protein